MNNILGSEYKTWYDDWYRDEIVDKKKSEEIDKSADIVWVSKRYDPRDLRKNAPVPRKKIVHGSLPYLEKSFQPPEVMIPLWGRKWASPILPSSVSTRCEEWSTLKQILPSKGFLIRDYPPNWGTGSNPAPKYTLEKSTCKRFPVIRSPMTRFVDDMHKTDRLFELF